MTTPTLLGKAELLAWAAQVTGITPCEKYADLRDGLIYLALARALYPHEVDSAVVRLQRRGTRDAAKNWSLLTGCLRRHGIPLHLCNRQAVERGHTRHCFNLLVLFYFLHRLMRGEQFSADFAQPVDPQLAVFLQSPDSVFALDSVSRTTAGNGSATGTDAEDEGTARAEQGSAARGGPVVTRLSSPPSAATPSPLVHGSVQPSLDVDIGTSRSAEVEYAVPLTRFGPHTRNFEREPPPPPFLSSSSHLWNPTEQRHTSATTKERLALLPFAMDEARSAVNQPKRFGQAPPFDSSAIPELRADTGEKSEAVASPASLSASLHTENQLLRAELQHVKAVSQLLITQQRGSEAAAEMRATATLHDALARMRLDHLHDLRQLEVALAGASISSPSAVHRVRSGSADDAQVTALAHRAEVAETLAAQLYEALHANASTYDSTLQQLQRVFRSIDTIASAARPAASATASSLLSPHASAAAYEDAVAGAMMAQLTCVPDALRDAFEAQLRALLVTLNALRVTNERLRRKAGEEMSINCISLQQHRQQQQQRRDWIITSTSPLSSTTQSIAAVCEEVRHACQTASPAVQEACHRLQQVVEELSGEVDGALEKAAVWEQQCREQEAIAASAEAALQRTRTKHSAQREQGVMDRSASSPPAACEALRAAPPDNEKAEVALEEAQRLYDRVAEVLVATFSTPGTEDLAWASHQLVSLLDTFLKERQSHAALERALAEQCDTIANLRREVRQRSESLAHSDRLRGELELQCKSLKDQLHAQEERRSALRETSAARVTSAQGIWLEQPSASPASSSHPQREASSSSLAHRAPAESPLGTLHYFTGNSGRASRAPETPHAAPPRSLSSPHQPGALRSPSPSTSREEEGSGQRGGSDLSLHNQHTDDFHSTTQSLSRPQPTLAASDVVHHGQASVVDGATSESMSTPARRIPTAMFNPASAAPSRLLSATELERRKQEILQRFKVE